MKRLLKHGAALTACIVLSYGVTLAFSEDRERIIAEWKCFSHFGGHCHCLDGYRQNATGSLKTLASAQAQFKALYRGEGVQPAFWRADVAGLYTYSLHPNDPIRLIELSVAAADDHPNADLNTYAVSSAKSGFWYRALRHAGEDPQAPNPTRYAYCAYPVDSKKHKYMYLLDETERIWRGTSRGRPPPDVFPTEQELQQFWARLD